MKALTLPELETFLHSLEQEYDVRAPIRLLDGSRALGRLSEGPLALSGGRLPRKPTAVFFPQQERMFTALPDGRYLAPEPPPKPLFILGFTAEDLDCLEFIDRFFTSGYADDLYLARRQGAVIAGLSGACGVGGEVLRLAGGKCDLELIAEGDRFLVVAYSEVGRELASGMAGVETTIDQEPLRAACQLLPDEDRQLLAQASALLRSGQVGDEFWAAIGERCIACTACNLVCPTCTCFGVQDWSYPTYVERSRIWDSCQLGGFMREASGHNPLGSEGLRTWRRIHHKLVADAERWGHVTCFLCRRCDAACPTGIGILAVCRDLVAHFGAGGETKVEFGVE